MPTGFPGKTHGVASTYTNGGCRCDACKQAYREFYGTGLTKAEYHALVEAPHGTESRYARCRCDECRAAATEARRRRRRAKAAS